MMRTKPQPITPRKTERQVIDEKLNHLNNFLKKIDVDKLHATIEKDRANAKK